MKKRIVSLLLLLVLSALMTVHSVAESTLASSVDEKSSPSFSPSNAGFIVGKGMDTVRVGHDEISIWAYAERQTAPESVRNSLGYAYSVIRGVSSLGELNAQLDAEAQTIDSSFSAAAFVVSDLFCPSLAENKLKLLQSGEERDISTEGRMRESGRPMRERRCNTLSERIIVPQSSFARIPLTTRGRWWIAGSRVNRIRFQSGFRSLVPSPY